MAGFMDTLSQFTPASSPMGNMGGMGGLLGMGGGNSGGLLGMGGMPGGMGMPGMGGGGLLGMGGMGGGSQSGNPLDSVMSSISQSGGPIGGMLPPVVNQSTDAVAKAVRPYASYIWPIVAAMLL